MTAPISFNPIGSTANIAATTTSSTVAVGTVYNQASGNAPSSTAVVGNQIRVYNSGSVIAFVAFGASTVAAVVATSIPIAPGTVEVFTLDTASTTAAAITGSGTATVYFTRGEGQ